MDLEGHKDKSAAVIFVTIWELGEAAGPLFIAPLSELFGRWPLYNACNLLLIVGIVMTALSQDIGMLIFSRFLTGSAVASNVLNPAVVGDIWPSKSRGSAMSAVMLAPLLGGAIGPAVAGALAKETGWRAIMWLACGLAGLCEVIYLTLFRETYKVVILQRRAARLRNETGNQSLRTEYDEEGKSKARMVLSSMIRPFVVMSGSFVLQIFSVWGALIFSFFYIMSTTLPDFLADVYGYDEAQRGVAFLSFSKSRDRYMNFVLTLTWNEAVGSIAGLAICNLLVDKLYVKLQARHGEKAYPEGRLPLPIVGAFAFPFIVALYGYAPGLHWPVWVLLLAVILMGAAIIVCLVPVLTYVTDAFELYSASAMTAILVLRNLGATFIPLASAPLIDKFGYGPGFLVFAAGCLVLAPIPPLILKFGPRWRQWSKYSKDE